MKRIKLTKLLAVFAIAVMALGPAMTALAATSVATTSATVADASDVSAAAADGTALTVSSVTETKVAEAQKAAVSLLGALANALHIEKVFELSGTLNGPTDITLSVPGITAGQKVAVLHQKADGEWENLPVTNIAAGKVTATFTSLSPVAIVTYGETSPKTGAAFPAAGVICAASLLGAAACLGKSRRAR